MGKIGIVTEGQSEVKSLPLIYPELRLRVGNSIQKPIFAQVDPQAPVPLIVNNLKGRIRLAFSSGADAVVVLLDRERCEASAGCRANQIEEQLREALGNDIFVVIKDRCFENWLVACPGSYAKQKARFPNYEIMNRAKIGCADMVENAEELINEACPRKRHYSKVVDSEYILKHASVEEIAKNSRSFRRFLAVLGDHIYSKSSRNYIQYVT